MPGTLPGLPAITMLEEKVTSDYTVSMLKSITESAKKKYDLNLGVYGDYDVNEAWPPKNFYTYNHHPRYLVNQFSLRNRMAILSEAFAHERFYQRIYSTYSFVNEILEYANSHATEILVTNKNAEEQAIKQVILHAGKVKKGVRFKMVPSEAITNFPTYDYIAYTKPDGTKGYYRTGTIIHVDGVIYHSGFKVEVESTLPRGYIIPAQFSFIAENLKKHGIKVITLSKSQSFTGEVYLMENLERSQNKFQGHALTKATGKFSPSEKKCKSGDYYVDLAQPLGNLAFYLLEPESDDGLVTWNFFDDYFDKAGLATKPIEYPIFKFYK